MIASYTVIASLGRSGGFGRVFKCKDSTGRLVAVKVLHSGSLAALNREVDILKDVNQETL